MSLAGMRVCTSPKQTTFQECQWNWVTQEPVIHSASENLWVFVCFHTVALLGSRALSDITLSFCTWSLRQIKTSSSSFFKCNIAMFNVFYLCTLFVFVFIYIPVYFLFPNTAFLGGIFLYKKKLKQNSMSNSFMKSAKNYIIIITTIITASIFALYRSYLFFSSFLHTVYQFIVKRLRLLCVHNDKFSLIFSLCKMTPSEQK